ncbi:MAG: hypothetical protein NVV68_08270 [Dokdonella sp.]|nr:hypothetical protein [Dokdonella sp.]
MDKVILSLLLYLMTAGSCWGAEFYYVNCADQGHGGPLFDCINLSISPSSKEIMIGDNGEVMERDCISEDYLCTGSVMLPISIPKKDYQNKKVWFFDGKKYAKSKVNAPSYFPWGEVDLIAVYEASGDLVLSFWYEKRKGVVAIGIPQKRQNSGEVFYLSGELGLFAE